MSASNRRAFVREGVAKIGTAAQAGAVEPEQGDGAGARTETETETATPVPGGPAEWPAGEEEEAPPMPATFGGSEENDGLQASFSPGFSYEDEPFATGSWLGSDPPGEVPAQPPPEAAEQTLEAEWSSLVEIAAQSLEGEGPVPDRSQAPAGRLLGTVATLAERIHSKREYQELARSVDELALAARAAHSVSIGAIGEELGLRVETGETEIESALADGIRERLRSWLREPQWANREAAVSWRQVGAVGWLELRSTAGGAAGGGGAGRARLASVASSSDSATISESYGTERGEEVARARWELALPTFEAYALGCAGRVFLVPVSEVEPGGSRVNKPGGSRINKPGGSREEAVGLAELLDLPPEWSSERSGAQGVAVTFQWRGRRTSICVDECGGPFTCWARSVQAVLDDGGAQPELRGVVGVARLRDGRKAAVLDLIPWLEAWERRRSESRGAAERVQVDGRYVVFRVGPRRFALPLASVRGVGKVDSAASVTRVVETPAGAYHLRDFRAVIGWEGECGSSFVLVRNASGVVAWAVDGLEPLRAAATLSAEAGGRAWMPLAGMSRGLVRLYLGSPQGSIAFLDPERLGSSRPAEQPPASREVRPVRVA